MTKLARPAIAGAIFLVSFALVVWGGLYIAERAGYRILPEFDSRTPGGAFTLTDHNGERFTERDLAGQPSLIYFGYTFCPDICPTHLNTMMLALEELDARGVAIRPIFVSIDPERDDVEQLNGYVTHFSDHMVGLTGTPDQVAGAAAAYGASYRKLEAEGDADYQMHHSALSYLMGPDGQFLTTLSPDLTPEAMAKKIRAALAGQPAA
ncbi:MAG: SCO family protein [Alphaproteobacteria bacterium]|nr:SCO family protein [Alphaproteobacteria bacterium]